MSIRPTGVRIPPHDLPAEAAVLGAMLVTLDAADTALRWLTPGDFYRPQHAAIFAAMADVRRDGPLDVVTLAAALGSDVLTQLGGVQVIIDLQAGTPATSPATVERYAQIVAEASTARAVIATSGEIAEAVYAGQESPIDLARERVANLSPAGKAKPPVDLTDVEAFLARAKVDRPKWVVPGLIRQGHRIIIVAPEGQGKMVLLDQIALCAAHGLHPFTLEVIPPVPVLLVPLENPLDAIEEQLMLTMEPLVRKGMNEPSAMKLWHREAGLDLRTRRGRSELEAVLAETRPALVVYGPLYRSGIAKHADQHWEEPVQEIQTTINELTARYKCCWLFEAHAPSAMSGTRREMRPYGSVQWRYWPDLGLGLAAEGEADHRGQFHRFKLVPFRGARVSSVAWPLFLDRGTRSGELPWVGTYPTGTLAAPGPADEPF